MKLTIKIAAAIAVLALSASPALALAPQAPDNSGTEHARATSRQGSPPSNQGTKRKPSTPGPRASAKSKAKAYGKYCTGQSKKHVKGQMGTPFSRCVTAMVKLASGKTKSPRAACKDLSHNRSRTLGRWPKRASVTASNAVDPTGRAEAAASVSSRRSAARAGTLSCSVTRG